jgi:hypothetical protein
MTALHRFFWLTLLGALTPLCGWSQDIDLQTLNAIAVDFQSRVHIRGIPDTAFLPPPKIRIYTTPPFSFYEKRTVTEARFSELPPPVQRSIDQWAKFTSDQPSGEALFRDMFYRFFFVHELGHWVQNRVVAVRERTEGMIPDADEDFYQNEIQSNRIAVAWWREHDPRYLARLVADFREIESHLPNPVPAGQNKVQYFIENYAKLGNDPDAYGWYQLDLVVTAYDQPKESFQQVLDGLLTVRYKRSAQVSRPR